MLGFASAVVAASLAVGQADSVTSGDELLRQFGEDYVGEWVMENEAKEDFLDLVKKGDKITAQSSIRWICRKKALTANWSVNANGKKVAQGRTLITWDYESNAIKEYGVSTMGGFGETKYAQEDGKWIAKFTMALPNGNQMSSTDTLTISDNGNAHNHIVSERVGPDGEQLPDEQTTWKRVKE